MRELRDFTVPPGSLTVWWLGQSGFFIKSPDGFLIALDPYLSNACKADGDRLGLDGDRMQPIPLEPEALVGVDLLLFTHSHLDHMDPETLTPYRAAGGTGPYLAPPETWERLQDRIGVPRDELTMTWTNREHRFADLTIRTTFAIGLGADDLSHVGYLVSLHDGPTFYFTGDTAFEDLVALGVRDHRPDVMFTVINGAFRNLGAAEASKLAKMIDPQVVIPTHYDMIPCNSVPPELLQTNMIIDGIGAKYRVIEHFKPWTYPERGSEPRFASRPERENEPT